MNSVSIFGLNIHPAIYVPVIYSIWVTTLVILKKISFSHIKKFADKTSTKFDDILIHISVLIHFLFFIKEFYN